MKKTFALPIGLLLPVMALGVLETSCRQSRAASETGGVQAPPGEVWLTPAQVHDAKIQVAPVGEQVIEDAILTSGTVTLDDQRTGHVFSPVTGRVVKIFAQLGQRVKKGEPLALIESPDIGSAVSDVHKAEADLISAQHDLKRKKDLFEQKAASAADVETSEDNGRKAKAELERARQKQFLLHTGNVDAVTQTYALPSPIDGEVLLRNINPGIEVQGQYSGGAGNNCLAGLTTIAACGELFTIGEIDVVWVLGDLYEIDMARVHVGAPASVTVLAYPGKVFQGKVDWVSGSLDANTRTAKVRCTFDNPDKLLRPLMYSTVRIAVDEKKGLAIPRSALLHLGEYKVVFARVGESDGYVRFERLPVDVDERESSTWIEVKHGLDPGKPVVVSGGEFLSQRL
jgi:cobalt-zinc-cadmium efflux system membrane fusion protein